MKQSDLIKKILKYANLESDLDDLDTIHETIKKDIVFQGTNLWILSFAIIVASVGLNINSTAVIIGAMLISPLMGPINGMGYGIATYDFLLLRQAVKNLSFAVVAGLIASAAYFALTPLSEAHSELLARTSPTIYDVLIALFGGLAGIVAITSKHKGNVIAGVAIATALMPPLCTAGYGLARGHFDYFFGALYLFTINTVFIALSSVIISRILRFPIRKSIDEAQKKKLNQLLTAVVIVVIIPSIYFGYNLVQNEKFLENAKMYVRNISVVQGNYLLSNDINTAARTVTLVYGGTSLSETQKETIKEKASDFALNGAKIVIQQGFSFDDVSRRNTEEENLRTEIRRLSFLLQQKQNQIDSLAEQGYTGEKILNEIRPFYPQIVSCSYAGTYVFQDTTKIPRNTKLVVFTVARKMLYNSEKAHVEEWLKKRLDSDSIEVYFEEAKRGSRRR
jgi:uncharacterized hydrophobic protein (TIGR00271 family)